MKAWIFILLLTAQSDKPRANITSAHVTDIQTVQGFLNICERKVSVASPENLAAIKTANDPAHIMEDIQRSMDASLADYNLCLGYLTGIIDGWKEGNEHGVSAMVFPEGVPPFDKYSDAVKALPQEKLAAARAGFNNDVFCLPEHLTVGETMNAVSAYMHKTADQNKLLGLVPTYRLVHPALVSAYPCKAAK